MFGPHCLGGQGIFEGGWRGGQSIFEARDRGGKQNLKVKIRDGNLVLRPFLAFPYKSNKPNVVDSFNL